jgi:hypothetical protein
MMSTTIATEKSTTVPTEKPSRQVRRADERRFQKAPVQCLAKEILRRGEVAQEAAALTRASLSDAELQAWRTDLEKRLESIAQHSEQNLGHIEEEIARAAKEPLRLLAERAAQVKANLTPCHCLKCERPLVDTRFLTRHIQSRFGRLEVWRRYGFCPKCEAWQFPADHALGLSGKAPASPYLQELCALLVTKMPPEQAVAVADRLGLDLSRCFLDREAHRQGLKAQEHRSAMVAQLDTWEAVQHLAGHTEGPPSQPFSLIIEIDAWNIRERDDWGLTEKLRAQGQKVERWHWVYMGTVFRLDHRGQTAAGRPLISQRGYVATRLGLEALTAQLYREALQRGLGQAQEVLVIADGALWIWNLAKDRFPNARQRLDLFHGEEHLWAIANDLYGRDTPEARAWVKPLLDQLRSDQSPALIQSLTQLLPQLREELQEKVQKQIDYFSNNANRMQYKAIRDAREALKKGKATLEQIRLANEPLGSGAIESTCRQYQCRFKRTGQFWTMAGDEALMCLETFWRNDRWHELYPHAKSPNSLN